MSAFWRRMFAKLGNAISRWRTSANQDPLKVPEDPFESIKKSISSIADHFKQLETDFMPSEPLEVDPKALPAKRKPRRKAVSDVAPTANSASGVESPATKSAPKASSKSTQKSTSVKTPVAKTATKKTVAKPAPKAGVRKVTDSKPATKKKPTAN